MHKSPVVRCHLQKTHFGIGRDQQFVGLDLVG